MCAPGIYWHWCIHGYFENTKLRIRHIITSMKLSEVLWTSWSCGSHQNLPKSCSLPVYRGTPVAYGRLPIIVIIYHVFILTWFKLWHGQIISSMYYLGVISYPCHLCISVLRKANQLYYGITICSSVIQHSSQVYLYVVLIFSSPSLNHYCLINCCRMRKPTN